MSANLDLDDVAATSPLAKRELDSLRSEVQALREGVERIVTEGYPDSALLTGHAERWYRLAKQLLAAGGGNKVPGASRTPDMAVGEVPQGTPSKCNPEGDGLPAPTGTIPQERGAREAAYRWLYDALEWMDKVDGHGLDSHDPCGECKFIREAHDFLKGQGYNRYFNADGTAKSASAGGGR